MWLLVDRLAARLRVQAAVERDAVDTAVERVDASADAGACLEHHDVPARVAQRGGPR